MFTVRLNHIYVQLIDDLEGKTLSLPAPTRAKRAPRRPAETWPRQRDRQEIAEHAKAKGVTKVVFDRGGYIYHGRVKATGRRRPRSRIAVLSSSVETS